MDEHDLKDATKYLRSEWPMPSEAYGFIADALEALWAQNQELREEIASLAAAIRAQGRESADSFGSSGRAPDEKDFRGGGAANRTAGEGSCPAGVWPMWRRIV
jgi:hypothetical protein